MNTHVEPTTTAEAPVHAPKHHKKALAKPFVLGLVVAIVVALVAATGIAYAFPPSSTYVRVVSKVVPLPAAIVDGRVVYVRDFLSERDALVTYYTAQQQAIPVDADLTKQILDTLINKAALENLAAKAGVKPDEAQLDTAEAEMTTQAGGEAAMEEQLKTSFGWTRAEFRARVLRSIALAEAMQAHVSADTALQADAKTHAEAALARIQAGEDFAKVAEEESDDTSGANGGDLGSVPESQIPPPALEAIKLLKKGEVSGIIETDGAFVILRLIDTTQGEAEPQYHLASVVIEKKTLEDLVNQELEGSKVRRLYDRS